MTSYADRLRKRWVRLNDAKQHEAFLFGSMTLLGMPVAAERHEDRYHRLAVLCLRLHDRMDAADPRPAEQPTLVEALHALGHAHDAVLADRSRA